MSSRPHVSSDAGDLGRISEILPHIPNSAMHRVTDPALSRRMDLLGMDLALAHRFSRHPPRQCRSAPQSGLARAMSSQAMTLAGHLQLQAPRSTCVHKREQAPTMQFAHVSFRENTRRADFSQFWLAPVRTQPHGQFVDVLTKWANKVRGFGGDYGRHG